MKLPALALSFFLLSILARATPINQTSHQAECIKSSDCPGAQLCNSGKCVEPAQYLSSVIILGTAFAAFVLYAERRRFGLG